jgi:serine/threonine-protein kinase RsbW
LVPLLAGKSEDTLDVTEDLSTVRLELDSRPEAPALVRAALAGVAQVLEFDPELFDDVKTAISEACNNAVLYAYDEGESGPLEVGLEIGPAAIEATVRDWGGGIQHVRPSDERMGVGLAVISALADRAEFSSPPGGGTEVRMSFTRRAGPAGAITGAPGARESAPETREGAPETSTPAPAQLSGDVVVSVWPVGLLGGVLGRVTRAVAGRTHLSLDRFSDIYLLTDAIAAVAESAAGAPGIAFAVAAGHRRLELMVGPFPAGAAERLLAEGVTEGQGRRLASTLGELAVEPVDGYYVLRAVVEERRDASG